MAYIVTNADNVSMLSFLQLYRPPIPFITTPKLPQIYQPPIAPTTPTPKILQLVKEEPSLEKFGELVSIPQTIPNSVDASTEQGPFSRLLNFIYRLFG